MPLPKYIVRLADEERTQLEDLSRTGKRAASVILHARILLKVDAGAGGSGWDDGRIAEAVECGTSTVYRVRQAFVEEGLAAALFRKKPTGRQYRKLDGAREAHLIALACGAPPEGRANRTCWKPIPGPATRPGRWCAWTSSASSGWRRPASRSRPNRVTRNG